MTQSPILIGFYSIPISSSHNILQNGPFRTATPGRVYESYGTCSNSNTQIRLELGSIFL